MLSVVNAAAGGDLTRDFEVTGDDSIAQMGDGIRKFFSDLRQSIGGISDTAASLTISSKD
jgi:methyl-accepting chemotaxis protein